MPVKQLWAPWRLEFIMHGTKERGCVFCKVQKGKDDKENLILHRAKEVYVILNKYPYNNGHMMVVPNKHTNDLSKLSPSELGAMWDYGRHATYALTKACKPAGFNLGMNLGGAAGAGIKEHLHLLAKLAFLLHDQPFQKLLHRPGSEAEIMAVIRSLEETIRK